MWCRRWWLRSGFHCWDLIPHDVNVLLQEARIFSKKIFVEFHFVDFCVALILHRKKAEYAQIKIQYYQNLLEY